MPAGRPMHTHTIDDSKLNKIVDSTQLSSQTRLTKELRLFFYERLYQAAIQGKPSEVQAIIENYKIIPIRPIVGFGALEPSSGNIIRKKRVALLINIQDTKKTTILSAIIDGLRQPIENLLGYNQEKSKTSVLPPSANTLTQPKKGAITLSKLSAKSRGLMLSALVLIMQGAETPIQNGLSTIESFLTSITPKGVTISLQSFVDFVSTIQDERYLPDLLAYINANNLKQKVNLSKLLYHSIINTNATQATKLIDVGAPFMDQYEGMHYLFWASLSKKQTIRDTIVEAYLEHDNSGYTLANHLACCNSNYQDMLSEIRRINDDSTVKRAHNYFLSLFEAFNIPTEAKYYSETKNTINKNLLNTIQQTRMADVGRLYRAIRHKFNAILAGMPDDKPQPTNSFFYVRGQYVTLRKALNNPEKQLCRGLEDLIDHLKIDASTDRLFTQVITDLNHSLSLKPARSGKDLLNQSPQQTDAKPLFECERDDIIWRLLHHSRLAKSSGQCPELYTQPKSSVQQQPGRSSQTTVLSNRGWTPGTWFLNTTAQPTDKKKIFRRDVWPSKGLSYMSYRPYKTYKFPADNPIGHALFGLVSKNSSPDCGDTENSPPNATQKKQPTSTIRHRRYSK